MTIEITQQEEESLLYTMDTLELLWQEDNPVYLPRLIDLAYDIAEEESYSC